MSKPQRDSKGRFIKGVVPEGSSPFSAGVAQEMQARSVAKRKENKTIAETLRAYLETDGGGGHTKGELLIMQAVNNHKNGKLSFRDLRDLARILGEDTLNIKTEGPQVVVVSQQAVQAAQKWSSKEEE